MAKSVKKSVIIIQNKKIEKHLMFRDEVSGAMHEEVNFNPKCIKMYESIDFDELEFGETLPFDIYVVGAEGCPIKIREYH